MPNKKNIVGRKSTRKELRRPDPAEWLAELRRIDSGPFMPEGRNQPMLHTKSEKVRFFKLADQLCATSDPVKRKWTKIALARIAFGK